MVIERPGRGVPSLYLHVPFCARKCDYCAFYSEAGDAALTGRYVDALCRELEMVAPELRLETVFFGGGTPSILSLGQWEKILSTFQRLGFVGVREWTVECNPATLSPEKARLLRDGGVNRVSLGVQSLDAGLLDRLGRVHSREMVFRSFEVLRRAGFENVNVDLMFAIPGQTRETWRRTLDEALALGSEHLSCYEVIYEEDTPLFAQLQAGEIDVDEDLACAMYEDLLERSAGAGFRQYEVANFARSRSGEEGELPVHACRHNVNYWRGGPYHGVGPSACGFVGGVRTRNWANTRLYCERLEGGQRAIESSELLPPEARAGEIAAFGLRLAAGWPFDTFEGATGFDLRRGWRGEMEQLVALGWGSLESDRFRLTAEGLRFADAAAGYFLRS